MFINFNCLHRQDILLYYTSNHCIFSLFSSFNMYDVVFINNCKNIVVKIVIKITVKIVLCLSWLYWYCIGFIKNT